MIDNTEPAGMTFQPPGNDPYGRRYWTAVWPDGTRPTSFEGGDELRTVPTVLGCSSLRERD